MVSDEPTEGRCNAEANGGYCENHPIQGRERCRHHGGKTPTADENPKQGRGDQEGNANAVKHFAFRKPEYLEGDIRGTEYEDVFIAGFEALCSRHEQVYGEGPNYYFKRRYRRYVLKDIKEDLIDAYLSERQGTSGSENPLVEEQIEDVDGRMNVEKANKLVSKMSDLSREIRLGLKDFGLLNSPEAQQAQATRELGDVVAEALEPQED